MWRLSPHSRHSKDLWAGLHLWWPGFTVLRAKQDRTIGSPQPNWPSAQAKVCLTSGSQGSTSFRWAEMHLESLTLLILDLRMGTSADLESFYSRADKSFLVVLLKITIGAEICQAPGMLGSDVGKPSKDGTCIKSWSKGVLPWALRHSS